MASKKENNKNSKKFSKEFKAELKKVVWPTPKQVVNITKDVIIITIITAVIVFILDFVFESINQLEVGAIKNRIEASQAIENEMSSQTDVVVDETASSIVEENAEASSIVE